MDGQESLRTARDPLKRPQILSSVEGGPMSSVRWRLRARSLKEARHASKINSMQGLMPVRFGKNDNRVTPHVEKLCRIHVSRVLPM